MPSGTGDGIQETLKNHGEVLKTVPCAKYLAVDVSSNPSWGSHIDRVVNSANKTLGFVKRKIKAKTPGVREAASNTLVRPQLEHPVAVWDPHHKDKIQHI